MPFDRFGTLVDWRRSVARLIASPAGRHGWNLHPFDVADAWRRRYGPSMDRVLSGERPRANLDALHVASLRNILAERGITPPGETIEEMVLFWHLYPSGDDAIAQRLVERWQRSQTDKRRTKGSLAL